MQAKYYYNYENSWEHYLAKGTPTRTKNTEKRKTPTRTKNTEYVTPTRKKDRE